MVSVSKLIEIDFEFRFVNSTFSIFKNNVYIGGGIKIDKTFKFELDPNFENTYLSLHIDVNIK